MNAGTVDLGAGALPSSSDTFVALFASGGNIAWSKPVTVGSQGTLKATVGPCGVVVATDSPTVDLGTGALSTASSIGIAALGL